ncbi:hypothetical protein [Acinetobacter bohemicus]|uniref:hypothetical protein n=1 Tax=Acinetobacter bohemicus TaxID=1435036 RepID=UPI003FA24231
MAKYQILLPDDIDEIEWLIEATGCFRLDVEIETEIYEFNFYDSVRLIQTMNDCLDCNTYFFEQNLMILPMVNIVNMRAFIEQIIDTVEINSFVVNKKQSYC